ncbi:hypothetical protein JOQ06_005056 [Pogonophryne albipinna]|uniref:Uncharacterized protein n=1 Tax=Pogonophryne albipinna TaxID=1090488 RepID=A0AAD6AQN0_9TELE|nr:hypothetical protein JOQ06_005056 [Pogonophryne albipinna]
MVFTKPVPNRMVTTGVRSGFYRGMFRVTEAYDKFSIEDRPLVTTMNMRADKPLVESAFGMVQEGSVLSYQMPALKSRYIVLHNGPPPTPLPLEGYDILPCECVFVCSEEELLHMTSLSVTMKMAHTIEEQLSKTLAQSGISYVDRGEWKLLTLWSCHSPCYLLAWCLPRWSCF